MRLILLRPRTIASSCGMAPPDSEVPAPRGTMLTPEVAAEFHHARDLFARARQDDGERQPAVGGERVGLESAPPGEIGDQAVGGQDRGQTGKDRVAPGEDGGVDLGKGDLRHD